MPSTAKLRWPVTRRPRFRAGGEHAAILPRSLVSRRDETVLTVSFFLNRNLFGAVYSGLQPDYFWRMPEKSGVFILAHVPTHLLSSTVAKPGDIDLLVLPYEGEEIVLERAMAIEIKAVRATFLRQGKKSGSSGFSQATGLKLMGFPYTAVLHLIVSDDSPEHAWRPMGIARILDEEGNVKILPDQNIDWLPFDLMDRVFGRLKAACPDDTFGFASAYLGSSDDELSNIRNNGVWMPSCKAATYNPNLRKDFLLRLGSFFDRYPFHFFDTPRFDP
jgi:hypothetical protein